MRLVTVCVFALVTRHGTGVFALGTRLGRGVEIGRQRVGEGNPFFQSASSRLELFLTERLHD